MLGDRAPKIYIKITQQYAVYVVRVIHCFMGNRTEAQRSWDEANREKNRERARRWSAENADKVRARQRAWIAANREKARATRAAWAKANKEKVKQSIATGAGITRKRRAQLLASQGGRCAICAVSEAVWCADHDHATGFVRGVLCRNCNIGLGMFRDDLGRMRAAAAYLARSQQLQDLL